MLNWKRYSLSDFACKCRSLCANFHAWTGNFTNFWPDLRPYLNFPLEPRIKLGLNVIVHKNTMNLVQILHGLSYVLCSIVLRRFSH